MHADFHIMHTLASLYRYVSPGLPDFQAYTDSDTTSAFVLQGKLRPLKVIEKFPEILQAFRSLGKSPEVHDSLFSALETFVCAMYGKPLHTDVNNSKSDVTSSDKVQTSAAKSGLWQ